MWQLVKEQLATGTGSPRASKRMRMGVAAILVEADLSADPMRIVESKAVASLGLERLACLASNDSQHHMLTVTLDRSNGFLPAASS